MKTEKYLISYLEQLSITKEQIYEHLGIDLTPVFSENAELDADDFLRICAFTGLQPEDVMQVLF